MKPFLIEEKILLFSILYIVLSIFCVHIALSLYGSYYFTANLYYTIYFTLPVSAFQPKFYVCRRGLPKSVLQDAWYKMIDK